MERIRSTTFVQTKQLSLKAKHFGNNLQNSPVLHNNSKSAWHARRHKIDSLFCRNVPSVDCHSSSCSTRPTWRPAWEAVSIAAWCGSDVRTQREGQVRTNWLQSSGWGNERKSLWRFAIIRVARVRVRVCPGLTSCATASIEFSSNLNPTIAWLFVVRRALNRWSEATGK